MLKERIKPEDFEIRNGLWDTPFQNSEKETVARNVIIISQENGNQWFSFTWEEYCEFCSHSPSRKELNILRWFVSQGLMTCTEDVFNITDEFIVKLWQFIKEEAKA